MITATKVRDDARRLAARLVDLEAVRAGSKMAAYEAVARRIGASSMAIRRLARGYEDGALSAHIFLNLKKAHDDAEMRARTLREQREIIMELCDADQDLI